MRLFTPIPTPIICHGVDDLRMVYFNMRQRIPVYADGPTQNDLLNRFGYAFAQPDGSPYPPILDLKSIAAHSPLTGLAAKSRSARSR